jgi:hypothetical protein
VAISYGLVCNPSVASLYTDKDYRLALRRAVALGVDYAYDIQRWTILEPSQGTYDTSTLARLCQETGSLPIVLNIPLIDSDGATHLPYALALDSTTLSNNFKTLLDKVKLALGTRTLAVLAVGCEVDTYFTSVSADIAKFATFMGNIKSYAASLWPGVKLTATFKWTASASWATYASVAAQCDELAFTLYGTNADFTVKGATSGSDDLTTLVNNISFAVFQLHEVGYPSSTSLGGSLANQSTWMTNTYNSIAFLAGSNLVTYATWSWLSDLPDFALDLGPAGNARQFTGTLGVRGIRGNTVAAGDTDTNPTDGPKTAWATLRSLLGGQSNADLTTQMSDYLAVLARTSSRTGDLTTRFSQDIAQARNTSQLRDLNTDLANYVPGR